MFVFQMITSMIYNKSYIFIAIISSLGMKSVQLIFVQ